MQNEIILYESNEITSHIEVKLENDTVWLTQEQMAILFGRNRVAITQHIGNIFKEGELKKDLVCKDFLQTTQHGAIKGKTQSKKVKIYNLDVIISVGYRVKSKQGTRFRIWATKVLREHLLKGYTINKRINKIEDKIKNLSSKIDDIDFQIKTDLPPKQGIFYDGQIFDAYKLVADIIRTAKKSIILIDNYIDDSVLELFNKRSKGVKTTFYTKNLKNSLKLDLEKYNSQYEHIEIKKLKTSHDRFLIIDNKTVYHFGASLKDLGKAWFAFSELDINPKDISDKL